MSRGAVKRPTQSAFPPGTGLNVSIRWYLAPSLIFTVKITTSDIGRVILRRELLKPCAIMI